MLEAYKKYDSPNSLHFGYFEKEFENKIKKEGNKWLPLSDIISVPNLNKNDIERIKKRLKKVAAKDNQKLADYKW